MRNSIVFNMVVVLAAMSATASRAGEPPAENWGPPTSGLQMSVRLEKAEYAAGEPIWLEMVIRNTTRDEIQLGFSGSDMCSFEFVIESLASPAGRLGRMPLTKYGVFCMSPRDAAKNILISVKGGEERHYRFPLSRMYDMTMWGSYSIVANRTVPGKQRYDSDGHLGPDDRKLPTLISNKLSQELK